MDAEENSAAVRLLWMQRRTVLYDVCGCRGEQCCFETVVNAEENSSAVRLLWMQRRTVLM